MKLRLVSGFLLLFIIVLTVLFVLGWTSSSKEALEIAKMPLPLDASRNPITRDASGNILIFDTDWNIVPNREPSLDVVPRYNSDNLDLTYHEITPYADIYDTKLTEITVLDKTGQMMLLPYASSQSLPVYYDPAQTKKEEVKPFVPSYVESVLLSNASDPPVSTHSKPSHSASSHSASSHPASHPHSYTFSLSVHP